MPGELVVHAEVVLQGDRGEGLVLLFDLHALLGLDRLVDAFAPAAALEDAAGELVDDLHLAALDDVVLVALVQLLGLQRHRQLVHQVLLHLVVQVRDVERLLDLFDAGFERHDDALVFFDLVVDVALQRAHDRRESVVQLGGVGDAAADDQRRTGLVDEDRVDLVDDREVVAALHLVGQRGGHVVAQVVEAELVVGAVGDVAGVVGPLLGRVLFEAGDDEADVEAHPLVDSTHPLGVEAGEVVVDRDEVHALATEAVEVRRQRADQCLALAGLHLGDPAEVQRRATHQLHVEVALADDRGWRPRALTANDFDQQIVEGLAALDPPTELGRLGLRSASSLSALMAAECALMSGTRPSRAFSFLPSPARRMRSRMPMRVCSLPAVAAPTLATPGFTPRVSTRQTVARSVWRSCVLAAATSWTRATPAACRARPRCAASRRW